MKTDNRRPCDGQSRPQPGSKHTPGPWTVGTMNDPRTDLSRGQYNVFPLPEDCEVNANARLIAAAPMLLEALEAARDDLRRRHVGWDTSQPLAEMVNAAIAHAKGEHQRCPCDECGVSIVPTDHQCAFDGQPLCPECFDDYSRHEADAFLAQDLQTARGE